MNISRRALLQAIIGVFILGNAGVGRAEEDTSRRPNVVFLLADQWRASATGYAGDPNVKTPYLDKLAKESINFETAVSVCPLCTPYRASLLTGRFPTTTGMITCDIPLAGKELCMAEIFKTAGYETAYIGKWHLNGYGGRTAYIPPERRQGFDYWKAAECDHNYLKSHYYSGNSPEMKYWEGYDAFAQTTDANQYIRNHAMGDKPFLLVVSYGTPHFPHHTAPEEFVNMYPLEKLKLPPNVSENMREAVLKELPGYYGHCSALDRCVGEVVQTLREAGIADNTILVFTSDHGDMTGTHDVRPKLKQYPWDDSIRVPFLLRYPAVHGKSPKSVKMPINTPDILPTLLGLSEIPPPATMEGEDLSAAIKPGAPEHDRAALIMNVWPNIEIQRLKEYRAIRTSRHTYVLRLDGPWLMYDNQTDPWQMNNLVNKPEHAELQKQLDTQLKAGLKKIDDDFHPSKYYLDKWGYKQEGSSLSFGEQK